MLTQVRRLGMTVGIGVLMVGTAMVLSSSNSIMADNMPGARLFSSLVPYGFFQDGIIVGNILLLGGLAYMTWAIRRVPGVMSNMGFVTGAIGALGGDVIFNEALWADRLYGMSPAMATFGVAVGFTLMVAGAISFQISLREKQLRPTPA